MKTLATQLHKQVEAVCPIVGVNIGKDDDKSTWKVCFDNATPQEQAAAQAVVDSFIAQPDPKDAFTKLLEWAITQGYKP